MIKKEIINAEESIKIYLNHLEKNVDPKNHIEDIEEAKLSLIGTFTKFQQERIKEILLLDRMINK